MHETEHLSVKGYIDEINVYEKELYFRGWCFHEKYPNSEVRLKYYTNDPSSETIEGIIYNIQFSKIREDVSKFYGDPNITNCGWKFLLHNNLTNIKIVFMIQMFFDDSWNTIFTREINNVYNTVIKPKKHIPSFVVIDNFYENPDNIREFALGQQFSYHPDYHKGKRTDQVYRFQGLKESFESILGTKIKNWENYGVNGCFQYCIAGDQLVYHHDTQEYAGVLFLTPDAPPQTGTTFYRSKYTKQMKVDNKDHNIVFKNGFLDPTEFDVVDVVGNVYNRLVLFDAQMIHAASTYFGNTLENGRLFQLFFFDLDV
jgi:hypothetical protein